LAFRSLEIPLRLKTIDIPNKNPTIKLTPSLDGRNLWIIEAIARENNPIGNANL
jgi:hypothetical protein